MTQSINDDLRKIVHGIKSVHKDYDPEIALILINKKVANKFYSHDGKSYSNPDNASVISD